MLERFLGFFQTMVLLVSSPALHYQRELKVIKFTMNLQTTALKGKESSAMTRHNIPRLLYSAYPEHFVTVEKGHHPIYKIPTPCC